MIELIAAYMLLVVLVTAPLVFMLKTRLWNEYFLFFISLSAFALLNVYGLYALEHSVYIKSPDFINFPRVFFAFLLVIGSFYVMFPIYQAFGQSPLALRWSTVVPDRGDKRFGITTVCLLWCFCAAVIAYYFAVTGKGSLFLDLAQGRLAGLGFDEIVAMRTERGFIGFQWFAPAFYSIPTFLVLYTYALRRLIPSRAHSLLFWLSLGTAIFLSVIFLSKMVVVFIFIGIAMAATLLESHVRFRILLIAGVGLAIAFWIYTIFFATNDVPLTHIGMVLWHRIIETYSMAAGIILSLCPEHLPFFNGVTINNPRGLLPYEFVDMASVIHGYLYGTEEGGATFAGVWEGYANFGYLGLAMFSMLIQLLVFALHLAFKLAGKNAFNFALFVFISLEVVQIWANSLFFTLIEVIFLLTLALLVGVRYGLSTLLSAGVCGLGKCESSSEGVDCLKR